MLDYTLGRKVLHNPPSTIHLPNITIICLGCHSPHSLSVLLFSRQCISIWNLFLFLGDGSAEAELKYIWPVSFNARHSEIIVINTPHVAANLVNVFISWLRENWRDY